LLKILNNDVEDPFCFFLKLWFSWTKSVLKFDLESLRDINLHYFLVLESSKDFIDLLCDELILELLSNSFLVFVI